ncbi:VanW family protein [Actinoplanes sp. RD1]|uniref:VanW family protein n=1 Tax=Actinoplanes sp. RD1 TaxID=3064538 RepID=UPI0027413635|nr:VanW family protein [Actinoplanes sp. RD1]
MTSTPEASDATTAAEPTVPLPRSAGSPRALPSGPVAAPRVSPAAPGVSLSPPPAGLATPPAGPATPSASSDTPSVSTPPGPLNRRRLIAVATAAAVLVAGAAATAWAYTGDVPRGVQVLGVDLGGKSRTDAERTLTEALAARGLATEPVQVDLDGKRVTIAPADIALSLDVDRTVGAAMRSGGPSLLGPRAVTPVVDLDEAKLEAALRKQVDPTKLSLKKPAITYTGTTPKPAYPAAGNGIDAAAAATAVRAAWPSGAPARVDLVPRPAASTREDVDALVADLARPAVAAPVTVRVGGKSFSLPPRAIAKGLVFKADDDGRLSPAVDGAKLRAAAATEFAKVETEPVDAKVTLAGGKPTVVAAKPGDRVDLTALGSSLLAVLRNPAPREVTASLTEQPADLTAADVAKLGIREKVSSFTTKFTGGASSPRSQNIMTIAREVDGAIVKPGQTFSLNKHTGERSYAQGYQDAPVIVGGKLEPGVGGGASQFTTTLFNAAYYAGLQDVEHKPHSFYFDRYPAVIESTIFYPTLDLRFKNTTDYGILVDTSYTSSSVTVTMWSTKVYDSVKTVYSPRRNITSPPTVHREPGPKCITSSGLPGFTQDAWRVIRQDGKEVKREKFTWRYDPEPRFVCGPAPQE